MTICDAISHLRLRFPQALVSVDLEVNSHPGQDPKIEWGIWIGDHTGGKSYSAKTLPEVVRMAEKWQDFLTIETPIPELIGAVAE